MNGVLVKFMITAKQARELQFNNINKEVIKDIEEYIMSYIQNPSNEDQRCFYEFTSVVNNSIKEEIKNHFTNLDYIVLFTPDNKVMISWKE